MSLPFCTRPAFRSSIGPNARGLVRCSLRWSHIPQKRGIASNARTWSTPLAKTIAEAIETTGPLSLSKYMRQCLTSPEGYYAARTRNQDPFGRMGDFVTSPEISQIFGELVGIWFVSQWISQGRRTSGIDLVEVGPGKGTLMDDILRALRNFQELYTSIEAIHFVEASEELRKQQKNVLCGESAEMKTTALGWSSNTRYDSKPINWYEDIKLVPKNPARAPFIVAHEFFDALPIQAFQSVAPSPNPKGAIQGLHGPIKLNNQQERTALTPQWRELLVNTSQAPNTFTTTSRPALDRKPGTLPDFDLTLAKASTPSSLVLPESSDRYKALKANAGSVIEVCPEGQRHAADFAERIGGVTPNDRTKSASESAGTGQGRAGPPVGAALIIDYGTMDTVPTSTLRGIKAHKLVSPFSNPGEVDLSADVDFTALAEAAIDASEGVEVHGPMEQGEWLERMGINERTRALCSTVGDDTEGTDIAKKLQQSAKRLVERGGGGMGKLYKVMAIVPENGGKRPVGFGGEIEL